MEQNLYFNETCDPVDLRRCSQYYVDPCDCTKFYQCAQNQRKMFHQTCGNGTIYNHNILVCDYPNDAICQQESPWKRCNAIESRTNQLLLMCSKNVNSNSDQNIMMQTILPTIFGVLVLAMLIGLVINRYKRSRVGQGIYPMTPESPYDSLDPSRMTRERIYTISDGSMGTAERLTRNDEIHLTDPYNSYDSFGTSTPEYCPCETQRFNPMYGVNPKQPTFNHSSRNSDRSYISVRGSDPKFNISTMPQPNDVQIANTQEGETVSIGDECYQIVEESDSTPSPSTIQEGRDADRECIARGVQSVNRPEREVVSNEDSSYSIAGESDTSPNQLAIPRPCDADRPVQSWKTQEDEIASSEHSSYVSVLEYDATVMPSDANREFPDRAVSSEDSEYVVQQLNPLFHPYISGNGPWHHKVIFNTKEHYFPRHVEPTPCTTFETT